jgi:hypothetical protein
LDKHYAERAHDVGTRKITKARELRDVMLPSVPTDAEFETAFATARVSKSYLSRYYLRALDKTLKNDPHPEFVANEDQESINLEHILPTNPSPEWGADSDTALIAQRLLGNMVLLNAKKNVSLGNSLFPDKKKAYAESNYHITKQVADYGDQWTIEEIKHRQAEMAKIAVKTWPLKID